MINQQTAPNSSSAAASIDPVRGSDIQKINTIRDILVGDQIHNLNDRFQNLEKSLEAHYGKLVNQLMAKFEAVQTLSKAEVDELRKHVDGKISILNSEDSTLTEEIKSTNRRIEDLGKRQEEMKNALADQVRKMYEEFSKQMTEFTRLVKNQHDEMNRQLVHRSDLANLLSGLASSIASGGKEQPKKGD